MIYNKRNRYTLNEAIIEDRKQNNIIIQRYALGIFRVLQYTNWKERIEEKFFELTIKITK